MTVLVDPRKPDSYLTLYEELLGGLRGLPVRLLELGIAQGDSLRMWREYFPAGSITGVDRELPVLPDDDRIAMYRGEQDDPELLGRVVSERGPFNIIIDDCAHVGCVAAKSFECLFPHVVPGGLYAIEDWGTGYWERWEDGASYQPGHTAGMVGFVKDLVDRTGRDWPARSGIARLIITAGLTIVVRA